MKIKVIDKSYEKVLKIPVAKHKRPKKPTMLFRWLMKTAGKKDVKDANVSYNSIGMEKLGVKEPCLILMNHSSFIDLEMATDYFYPRPLSIVCTSDGFVGKEWLMRRLGCIPTQKFVHDSTLVYDIKYALKTLGSSVLMYPEASYTFDGTATTLPDTIGRLIKLLKVSVVTVITHGAFVRDPLYNGLRKRKVSVEADVEYFLSANDTLRMSAEEINSKLKNKFSFDNFAYQYEHKIRVAEDFRAEGLNRVLYKCPHCKSENGMTAKGERLTCRNCGAEYRLTEYGIMEGVNITPIFTHIPDWYRWEREEVKKEILEGIYSLDIEVEICIMKDYKAIYRVGKGNLTHNLNGFRLVGLDGKIDYKRGVNACYGLYADYYWYEIGDMICIGDENALYYCFPINSADVVAKTRMATEVMYELSKSGKMNVNKV